MFPDFSFQLILLAGPTGSGKTAILEALSAKGYPVINLEKIARHKGSVFGSLGSNLFQPSPQEFSEELQQLCYTYSSFPFVFTEQEAPAIGKRRIPKWFYEKMVSSLFIYVHLPKAERVRLISAEYGQINKQEMCGAIDKLNERLSGETIAELKSLVLQNRFPAFAERMLDYYDNSYHYKPVNSTQAIHLSFESFDTDTIIREIENKIGSLNQTAFQQGWSQPL